ncbi:hypothetical protein ADK59_26965 [Streptomyces sp. XY332]|nr:hypothetical protein ADK59_26965 [Streptomyces sp. XY332]
MRSAYAAAAQEDGAGWRSAPTAYAARGIPAALWRLGGGRVPLVEVRIPDSAATSVRGRQLWSLYADGVPATTLPSDQGQPPQDVSRQELLDLLRQVVAGFGPTVVNTLDPTADQQPGPAHGYNANLDHVATSRLVMAALARPAPGRRPETVFYRDYSSRLAPPNLDETAADNKWRFFGRYALHDMDICTDTRTPCPPAGTYAPYRSRQYRADAAWRGDLRLPYPADLAQPRMGGRYRIINAATGRYLAADGDRLTTSAATDDPGRQEFTLEAAPRGWRLAQDDGRCVDVPRSGPHPTALIMFGCTGKANQSFILRGTPTSGYTLTPALPPAPHRPRPHGNAGPPRRRSGPAMAADPHPASTPRTSLQGYGLRPPRLASLPAFGGARDRRAKSGGEAGHRQGDSLFGRGGLADDVSVRVLQHAVRTAAT